MIFCINCGARNENDAIFCLCCGQTLYRGHKHTAPRSTIKLSRTALAVLGTLLVVTLVLVLSLHFKKLAELTKGGSVPSAESGQAVPALDTDKAVLTIVASNRTGSLVSQGSGFILTSDGLAGSNYHVLEGSSEAVAECCGGRAFEIRSVEGVDFNKDLVIFQVYERGRASRPHDLPHVTLASSQKVTVGEKVVAIGSPQGLENTVSDGILSAVREFDAIRFLQITAPISPGSSGGPVFNSAGEMIGIATFQLKKGQNLNFAVAAENLNSLLDQHLHTSIAGLRTLELQTKHEQRTAGSPKISETPNIEQPSNRPLTGQYGGIVHNLSSNTSAEFGVLVNDIGGVLSGCMAVKQPLFGSGPLLGSVVSEGVSFTVTSAIGTITFTGTQENESIRGTYIVEHQGAPKEEGTFTLSKINSKGLPTGFVEQNCPTDAEIHL